jgi:prophage regulatory protein
MVIGDRGPRKLAALVVGPTVEIRFCCMFVGWRSSRLVPPRLRRGGHPEPSGEGVVSQELGSNTTKDSGRHRYAETNTLDRVLTLKLLRFPMVRERTGLSRSTIWRLERQGDFPKHRRISANVVAWVEAEVMSWIHSKVGDIAV